jgi:hypothetical protein
MRLSSSRPRQALLRLEALEERAVPTILFSSSGNRNVVDHGGPVITHAQVDLIFWGAGWNTGVGPNLKTQLTTSVGEMMNSTYLSGLSQYRGVSNGSLLQTDLITTTSPGTTFTDAQVSSFVATNINNHVLPAPTNPQILYMVVPQPGSSVGGGIGGEHNSGSAAGTRYHYGWTITSNANVDFINNILSHEITEATTDAEVNFRTAFAVSPTNDEVCDGEAQNYSYRLNGALVQSSLSQVDHAYDIYDGNSQKFLVSNTRVLTINGDQLPNHDDTITVDLSSTNGVVVTLDGETVQFEQSAIRGIVINSGTGNDTINILRTVTLSPVTVNSRGTATINIGNGGSLQNLAGAITVTNPNGGDTINIDDSADTTARNARIETVTQTGNTYTRVSGLGTGTTGTVNIGINDAANITVLTGTRGSTVTLVAVSAPLTLIGSDGSGGFNTLIGSGPDNNWSLSGQDAGSLSGSSYGAGVSFSGFQNLTGAASATDTFTFGDGAGVSGNLTAGGGGGTLDYTSYSTSVVVDLQTGSATGVGGTISNIGAVLGGTGNGSAGAYNLLIGAGGNYLQGGTGRVNILVAGASASTLVGGDGEDLLIGGTTSYDQEAGLTTWLQIASYWAGTDDRATRTANLLAGTGVPLLDATVVTGNGGGNVLNGNGAWALIYTDGADTINGFDPAANQVSITP